jgi:putative ABC transport system permease protein
MASGGPVDLGVTFGAFELEGQPPAEGGRDVVGFQAVSPEFLQVAGIPLLAGRNIDKTDTAESVLVSQSLARRIASDGDAVGRRFRMGGDDWWRVVGIVGDVSVPRPGGADGLKGQVMYVSATRSEAIGSVLVRTTSALGLNTAVRAALDQLDPTIRLREIRPADMAALDAQALPRFIAGLLTTFAALAVVMSAIGLYGVIAYTVTRRRREIGIRMALGAQHGDVLTPVMVNGLGLTMLGLVVGLAAAYVSAGALRSLLFVIEPFDPATFIAAGAIVAIVAAVAVIVPALKAVRVNPVTALRES